MCYNKILFTMGDGPDLTYGPPFVNPWTRNPLPTLLVKLPLISEALAQIPNVSTPSIRGSHALLCIIASALLLLHHHNLPCSALNLSHKQTHVLETTRHSSGAKIKLRSL